MALRNLHHFLCNLVSDYEMEEKEFASGQFGQVFKGTRKSDSLQVAIKKISQKKNPSNKEKFKFKKNLIRELSILANIRHPFCLNLVNFSFENDQPIIITPLMSNGNIYDLIKDDNKEHSTQKNCSIYALCSTMDFLHKAGIIHRDLKPQNIFIDNDKNICIADFGLSRKVFQNIYLTTESMGTPLYMAPELIEGESYTNTVDVYAFGVIYYQFFSTKMILKGQKKQPKDPNSFMFKVGNGARFVQPTNMSTKQYDFYKECTLQDLDKRPSFEQLAKKFETDKSLWLDGVDKDEFLEYVEKCKKINQDIFEKQPDLFIKIDKDIHSQPSYLFRSARIAASKKKSSIKH